MILKCWATYSHGNETRVWGIARLIRGKKQVIHERAPNAKDFTQRKGSRLRQLTEEEIIEQSAQIEKIRSPWVGASVLAF